MNPSLLEGSKVAEDQRIDLQHPIVTTALTRSRLLMVLGSHYSDNHKNFSSITGLPKLLITHFSLRLRSKLHSNRPQLFTGHTVIHWVNTLYTYRTCETTFCVHVTFHIPFRFHILIGFGLNSTTERILARKIGKFNMVLSLERSLKQKHSAEIDDHFDLLGIRA